MSSSHKWKDTSVGAKEWQERTRAKIQASKVIDNAIKAAEGEIEVSTSRATMMKALMDRVLPAQTQATVENTNIEAPQDLEELKAAIEASPELQSFLFGLLQKNNKEEPKPVEAEVSTRLQ